MGSQLKPQLDVAAICENMQRGPTTANYHGQSDADHDYFSRLAASQPPPCDEDAPMEGACDADCGTMDLDNDENAMVPASPLQKRSPAAVLGGREAKRARLAEL